MVSFHYLLSLLVTIQLSLSGSNSLVLGLKKICTLCNGPTGEPNGHRVERLSGEEITSVLALGEPCGVYTLPCTQGLRCIPPLGEQSPLQALLQGRGVCRNIKSTFTDIHPPTDYHQSITENNEKGPCRKLLNSVLQSIDLTIIHSIPDIYIPNCDRQGFFRRKQCRSSRGRQRGHCWCVDEKGSKISSRKRSDGTISCNSA
ncbi:insulin-like growth factor-binding protein 5 [Carassius carassius]|uniref:insulin-like growth factor-binding protein 5 n=1 Tax=Carassius carassius TaxID=217509 RepID=UPI0028690F84|nr:insulin-like growth factor-binding protein 5 [Carassius carassius]